MENSSFDVLYFTSCRIVEKKKIGCQIYKSKKSGQEWGDPELVPLGKDSVTFKQPSIYEYTIDDFEVKDYNPLPPIKFPIAV